MQQCTMLSTDDGFPWGAVILLTILLTTLFTTIIILAPKLLSRWFKRRDMPVVEAKEEEEVTFRIFFPITVVTRQVFTD